MPSLSIGDVVSFSFESSARRELPVNPRIYRIRTDIEWEDVVENVANEQRFLNGIWCVRVARACSVGVWLCAFESQI